LIIEEVAGVRVETWRNWREGQAEMKASTRDDGASIWKERIGGPDLSKDIDSGSREVSERGFVMNNSRRFVRLDISSARRRRFRLGGMISSDLTMSA
jgi:hypothetical protein